MPPHGNDEPYTGRVPFGYMAVYESAMRQAIDQALRLAEAGPLGDVPVGAVVVAADGTVIGAGHNRCIATTDPTAHAEIVAIRQAAARTASWRLDGCTLVVTLEPCSMCAGAVHSARIRRVVYGAPDPRAGAAGSLWDILRDRRLGPPVEVIGGVLAEPCGQLLSDFFGRLRAE